MTKNKANESEHGVKRATIAGVRGGSPVTNPPPLPRAVVRRKSRAEKEAAAWIESINPLRGMTIAHAQSIFDAARRGSDVRLQCVYANMEQIDPTLLICAERRSGALIDLDWTIRPKAAKRVKGYDERLADEQVACLEAAFGDAEERNLVPAIEHLASAFFRGHAHVLPRWSADGLSLRGFDCLDAWNVCRDLVTGEWHWNPTASETLDFRSLEVIPPGELCTLVRSRHVDYPAMAIYLRAALGEKAWGRFLERYGVPPVIITMPPDIDPSRVEEYAAAAEKVADGGTGALPNGSAVTYATEARGTNPFKEFLEHQQQLVVLMATGGMLTSLTGATGIGQGASDAHEETWRMIVRRDASAIATSLNRTISDALLDRCFPGKPHLAQFDFETEPAPGPDEVFDIAAKAVAAGYRVTREELEERTGYKLELPAPPMQGLPSPLHPTEAQGASPHLFFNKVPTASSVPSCVSPSPATERSEPISAPNASLTALAAALQADLSPAAEAVQELLRDPSPETARALIDRLPHLLPDDPEMAAILEETLADTFGDTLMESGELGVESGDADNSALRITNYALANSDCRAKDPATCRVHGNQPGAGQREPETKAVKDSLGRKFDPEHPDRYTATDNIARGKKAIRRAIEHKEDVKDAMYRPECGAIDFDWGSPGTRAKDRVDGKGISHAFKKHPNDIERLPEILAKGTAYKVKSDVKGVTDYHGRIAFVHGDGAVFVDPAPKGKGVLISGYRKRSEKGFSDIEKEPKA